ncbi:MAG TPA: SPOR domain-containing protein [Telluria sp.]|nr:SPOR domain-containing protein [Telluria sp.]
MLKFIFWSLLCINGALLAYGQGYLGTFKGNEREPARIKNQLNPDKLALVTADKANAAALTALDAAKPAAAPVACVEIGSFSAAEARRFEVKLEELALGERQTRQNVASQDLTSHIVYIPPLGSKDAADKKAAELKNLGVTNYFIMSDNSPMKWGISLGVFKSEAAAQTLLAALNKQGVHSARITGRGAPTNKLAYQFRNIDTGIKAQLDEIKLSFPMQEERDCK